MCTLLKCIEYVLLPDKIDVNINTYLNLFLLFLLIPSDPVMLV
jgi:hypothetical protein